MKAAQVPSSVEEQALRARGYPLVAGVDEAGRGPLAGPVVAAAVILPTDAQFAWLRLVRDSKKLSPLRRQFLFDCIQREATVVGLGVVSADEIDALGILPATRLAMGRAVVNLHCTPDYLLVDALTLPDVKLPQKAIVRGDSSCLSIAAASIVAKVSRDLLMLELDRQFQGYGFARHKGYATAEHLRWLRHLGPCPIHRKSFAPVRRAGAVPQRPA